MSDTPIDNAPETVAPSATVAPSGDTQGSTPAPADTAANGNAEPKGEEPDKQSRRESRAFATQRRENRDLHRQIGRLEAMIEGLRPQSQSPEDGQPPQRQITPQDRAAFQRNAEITSMMTERLEDAGDEIEGFDKVMATITSPTFPGTVTMRDFLMETERPAEMAKWLADNPQEARRISLLSDAVATRALERAEARLAKPAPKTTKAPPIGPSVGGRSTAAFDPGKTDDMDEYKAYWDQRQAKK